MPSSNMGCLFKFDLLMKKICEQHFYTLFGCTHVNGASGSISDDPALHKGADQIIALSLAEGVKTMKRYVWSPLTHSCQGRAILKSKPKEHYWEFEPLGQVWTWDLLESSRWLMNLQHSASDIMYIRESCFPISATAAASRARFPLGKFCASQRFRRMAVGLDLEMKKPKLL